MCTPKRISGSRGGLYGRLSLACATIFINNVFSETDDSCPLRMRGMRSGVYICSTLDIAASAAPLARAVEGVKMEPGISSGQNPQKTIFMAPPWSRRWDSDIVVYDKVVYLDKTNNIAIDNM